jgi:hypothetical protein
LMCQGANRPVAYWFLRHLHLFCLERIGAQGERTTNFAK